MVCACDGQDNRCITSQLPFLSTDCLRTARRLIPPIPSFYPIEPVSLCGPGADSGSVQPVNYMHLFRGSIHTRFALAVRDVAVALLATRSPYDTSKSFDLSVAEASVGYNKRVLRLAASNVVGRHVNRHAIRSTIHPINRPVVLAAPLPPDRGPAAAASSRGAVRVCGVAVRRRSGLAAALAAVL